MNKVILIGRLVRDPELRYTQGGVAVCNFTIVVDRPFTNQNGEREADFIDIVVWRKAAENVAKYMAKGRQVAVEGALQIRSYEDGNGIRRKAAEIVADRVEFLGSAQDNRARNDQFAQSPQEHQQDDFGGIGEEVVFDDDDLPF